MRGRLGLFAHRVRQLEERLALGTASQDQGLVFCGEDGSPLPPGAVSQRFAVRVRRAGLPNIRLHDLRHTYATLALSAGIHPKVVQERLGHSTVTMTLDLYSHAVPSMEEEAAQKVAALFL
jgi:integrase